MNARSILDVCYIGQLKSSKADTYAASLILMGFYFIYSLYYALFAFIQFPICSVILVGLLFLVLLLVAELGFNREKFNFSGANFGVRTCLVAFLALLFAVIYSQPSLSVFTGYIRTFPILELESGAGFNQDTAYHVSLIQSILNSGYPSTAQHGMPFNMYHVMSHSVDALLLKITGLNPYDSYGLFYRFKTFVFVSASVLFIGRTVRGLPVWAYIISIVALLPVIFSSWHGIGSHGLWVASLMLLASANYLYYIISKEGVSIFDYAIVFLLVMIVSFAKVSTGFMLGSFIGVCLFLNNYRRIPIYIFGVLLLLFFYGYSLLFQAETSAETSLSGVTIHGFISFFSLDGKPSWYAGVWFLYFFVGGGLVWLAMYAMTGRFKYLFLSLAGFLSIVSLYIVISMQKGLNSSEQWYFIYGLGSIMILFFYMSVVDFISSLKVSEIRFVRYDAAVALVLVASLIFVQELPARNISFFDKPVKQHIWDEFSLDGRGYYFNEANKLGFSFSAGDGVEENRRKMLAMKKESWIYKLDESLGEALKDRSYSSSEVLMFVPRHVYDDEVDSLEGPKWASGLLIYSLFGVPLAHGVERVHRTYGLSNYDDVAVRKESISVDDMSNLCEAHGVKGIIRVNSLVNIDYEIEQCSSLIGS